MNIDEKDFTEDTRNNDKSRSQLGDVISPAMSSLSREASQNFYKMQTEVRSKKY